VRPLTVFARFLYVLGGLVVPVACFVLVATVVFGADPGIGPRDRRAGWHAFMLLLFHREANWGFGLLLLASGVALCVAISDPKRFAANRLVRALVALGALVSASYVVFGACSELAIVFFPANLAALVLWPVFSRVLKTRAAPVAFVLVLLAAVALLVLVVCGEASWFLFVLAAGPAWSLIAYASLWRRLRRESRVHARGPFLAWLAAYGAAFAYAFFQASRLYRELPEHRSDCYVATAAARGHRRLVGPWPSPQLLWLKRGELVLAQLAPRVHRRLRRVYDRAGPPFAQKLRHPLAADLAYLSLKPAEWAVRAAFAVLSLRRNT
jgi:hypothetical protein